MPEEPEGNQEEQKEETTNPDGAPTAEDLATIKAELEQEKKAIAEAQAIIEQKDTAIADLEAKLHEADENFASLTTQVSGLKEANANAITKYLEVSRSAHPTIPADVIAGTTIQEIDDSLAKALSIEGAVKTNLEAQAKETKVPAGAPPRTEINLEGLSPREKIAAGIQQKGGTS